MGKISQKNESNHQSVHVGRPELDFENSFAERTSRERSNSNVGSK